MTENNKMTEHQIAMLLTERFKDHACFRQFRTITGYGNARFIDLVAVGMWSKNWGIKAFEIKTDRQDFYRDVAQFEKKQDDALAISNEFYYVCPHLMIDPTEVPKDAGLYTVMKNGTGLRKIKQAPYHKKLVIEMDYFMAFAREFGNKIDLAKVPVKYLGHEVTQDDFMELVEARRKEIMDHKIEEKAGELNKKLVTDNKELRSFRQRVKQELGISYPWQKVLDDEVLEKLKNVTDFVAAFNGADKGLQNAITDLQRTLNIIQDLKKL